jgi:hypothetical protein
MSLDEAGLFPIKLTPWLPPFCLRFQEGWLLFIGGAVLFCEFAIARAFFLILSSAKEALLTNSTKIPNFETYNPVKNSLVETLFKLSHSILLMCYQIWSKAS